MLDDSPHVLHEQQHTACGTKEMTQPAVGCSTGMPSLWSHRRRLLPPCWLTAAAWILHRYCSCRPWLTAAASSARSAARSSSNDPPHALATAGWLGSVGRHSSGAGHLEGIHPEVIRAIMLDDSPCLLHERTDGDGDGERRGPPVDHMLAYSRSRDYPQGCRCERHELTPSFAGSATSPRRASVRADQHWSATPQKPAAA